MQRFVQIQECRNNHNILKIACLCGDFNSTMDKIGVSLVCSMESYQKKTLMIPYKMKGKRKTLISIKAESSSCLPLYFFICLFVFFFRKPGEQKRPKEPSSLQCMHLAVVACGDRLEETLIMLKSAVLFSNKRLCFHIFAEDSLKPEFEKKVSFFVTW